MKGTEEEIGAYAGLPGLFSRVKIFKAFRIYHGNPLIIMAGPLMTPFSGSLFLS